MNGNAGTYTCTYLKVVWAKPVLLSHAIKVSPQGALLLDIDVVLNDNLAKYIQDHRAPGTMLMGQKEEDDIPNTGIIWASNSSGDVMNRWIDKCKFPERISMRVKNGCDQPLGCPPGDMDCLESAIKEKEDRSYLQVMPWSIAQKEGRKAKMATHYTGGDKIM